MNRKIALGTVVGLALLALGTILLLFSTPVSAVSDTRYVATAGEDASNDCLDSSAPCATIQHAVDQANAGDEIWVAQGVYTDLHVSGGITSVVRIDKDLAIRGGYTTTEWSVAYPLTQPAVIDAGRQGQGIIVNQNISVTLEGLRITNGAAFRGAGILTNAGVQATISRCWIYNNSAERYSGGIHVYSSTLTLIDSYIYSNTAGWDGGGVNVSHSSGTLTGNSIYGNKATLYGAGGVYLNYGSDVALEDNRIYSNTASYYGAGVYLWTSNGITLTNNYIYSNTADYYGGGGVYLRHSDNVLLMGNRIYGNEAKSEGSGVLVNDGHFITMTNDLLTENQLAVAPAAEAALSLNDSVVHLLHTTIARNAGWGLKVYRTTLWMTNTILVSHTVGISVTAGSTATLEATLWGSGNWANGTDYGGSGVIITGTINIWGDPAFVNPDGGDYHLGPGSAARNAGVNAGVSDDIDGDTRPMESGYDIGADEFWPHLYLPLVMRRYP